jgi:hypothetical protein
LATIETTSPPGATPTPTPTLTPTPTISVTPTPTSILTITPTVTPPFDPNRCLAIFVYDDTWNKITGLSTLKAGQKIYFTVLGTSDNVQGITKARFRFNLGSAVGSWQETIDKRGNEFYLSYTIPFSGSYTVEAMVFNPELGWF